jgi:uncharacterized protein
MTQAASKPCTAFDGRNLIAAGPLSEVALAVKVAIEGGAPGPVLVFDDATGGVIDLDLRGSSEDVLGRLDRQSRGAAQKSDPDRNTQPETGPRGRGRPKLGVVAREVTLLPRHWDWLAAQSGGASAVLRRLVDEARRSDAGRSRRHAARDAAYRFMSAMAGNFPGFEEASRALFADDRKGFAQQIADWPVDIRAYLMRLASGAPSPGQQDTAG